MRGAGQDIAGFGRMMNQAMAVRKTDLHALAAESGVSVSRLQQWTGIHFGAGGAPTARELAGLAKALDITEADITQWLSLDTASFQEHVWLMASVAIPGLTRAAWGERWISGDQEEEDDRIEDIDGLIQSLVLLVMRYGPGSVAGKAQELFLQTKEGREQQARPAKSPEEEAWGRQGASAVARSKDGRQKSKAVEDARRQLGG